MLYANTKYCWGSWERHQVCGAELYIWSQQLPPKYHPGDKLTGKSVTLLHIVSSSQHWQLRYRTGFVKISRSLVLRPTTDTFTFSFSSLHNSLISSWWIFAERSSESLKTLKSKREKNNLTVIQQLQKIEIQFVREFGFSPPKLINNGSLKVKGGVSGCKHVGEDGNTLSGTYERCDKLWPNPSFSVNNLHSWLEMKMSVWSPEALQCGPKSRRCSCGWK